MLIDADLSSTLDRILDTAADNSGSQRSWPSWVSNPNNVTYDAIFNRLLEILLHNITLATCLPWLAPSSLSPPC